MTLKEAVWKDPGRMSGVLCFRNTRIPVTTLLHHLKADEMDVFFEGFPDVSQEMVDAVLEAAFDMLDSKFVADLAA